MLIFTSAERHVAERQRSRSEADTGRRTGLCFGLRLFFGRENRLRFSRRAGLRMGLWCGLCFGLCFWPGFGLEFGPRASSAVLRTAGLVAQRLCRLGGWATGRTRQLWAVNEVLLLRPNGSRGPQPPAASRSGGTQLTLLLAPQASSA